MQEKTKNLTIESDGKILCPLKKEKIKFLDCVNNSCGYNKGFNTHMEVITCGHIKY